VTGGQQAFLWAAAVGAAAVFIGTSCGAGAATDGSQRQGARGQGDDQYKEGIGIDLALQLGCIQPADHTRWHYGGGMPGTTVPTNWSRHRLGYPRRQSPATEQVACLPLNHPVFPKNMAKWFYEPPADEDL